MNQLTETARANMLKQQLRTCEVTDERLLSLLQNTPREKFVPVGYESVAFSDSHLPLGHGQVMLTPLEEASLLQALQVQSNDVVLEIGTGSGYLTALLAKLAKHVFTVDIHSEFVEHAQVRLAELGMTNVSLICGDASRGWQENAPYDVIVVTGSLPVMPENLIKQLNVGGRMFVVLGDAPAMEAMLVTRETETEWQTSLLFKTVIPPLTNALEKNKFRF